MSAGPGNQYGFGQRRLRTVDSVDTTFHVQVPLPATTDATNLTAPPLPKPWLTTLPPLLGLDAMMLPGTSMRVLEAMSRAPPPPAPPVPLTSPTATRPAN